MYIVHPFTKHNIPLHSYEGKTLLKKYLIEYNKNGGRQISEESPMSLKNVCHTALYGRKRPDNIVQTKCRKSKYMNDNRNSIKFIKKNKNIKNTRFVEMVAEKVSEFINRHTTTKGYITILGSVEDILGFFIKYVSNKKRDNEFKRYIILSVKDKAWSTDFNYDFINCSIQANEKDNDNFSRINNDIPVVLINVGENSAVKNHDPDELLTKLPRVTRCEIQWIHETIQKSKYSWDINSIKISGKTVWINMLKLNES